MDILSCCPSVACAIKFEAISERGLVSSFSSPSSSSSSLLLANSDPSKATASSVPSARLEFLFFFFFFFFLSLLVAAILLEIDKSDDELTEILGASESAITPDFPVIEFERDIFTIIFRLKKLDFESLVHCTMQCLMLYMKVCFMQSVPHSPFPNIQQSAISSWHHLTLLPNF